MAPENVSGRLGCEDRSPGRTHQKGYCVKYLCNEPHKVLLAESISLCKRHIPSYRFMIDLRMYIRTSIKSENCVVFPLLPTLSPLNPMTRHNMTVCEDFHVYSLVMQCCILQQEKHADLIQAPI